MKQPVYRTFTIYITLVVLCLFAVPASAQTITKVRGVITDSKTGETLPGVSVLFPGRMPIGTTSDADGKYTLDGVAENGIITVAMIGYEQTDIKVKSGQTQVIDIKLKQLPETLDAVVIQASRGKYSNKNNPAVDLIRKMIANKNNNRLESREYYEYEKYEKLELGLNDFIVDSAVNKKTYNRLQVIFNHLNYSDITGKMVLPVFFKESASSVYYRKSPESKKEYVNATRMIDLHEVVDMESVENYVTDVFGNMNVYDNEMMLFDNKYMGPLAPFAPNYYRFHIIDTLDVEGVNCIRLNFTPRNEGDFGFRGSLYVTNGIIGNI